MTLILLLYSNWEAEVEVWRLLQVSDWTEHKDECKEIRKEYVKYELEQCESGKDVQLG